MKDKYIPQLDGLRTIAVFLVMFGHYTLNNFHFKKVDHFAASAGVNLFFVLSGFLISGILLSDRDKNNSGLGTLLKIFYIRRFLRIFPLYYFIILLGLILAIPLARVDFVWLVLYGANFKTIPTDGNLGFFTHLWSLSVEEQFYIFFPLFLLLTPKQHVKYLAIILIVTGVVTRTLPYFLPVLQPHLHWFYYGFTTCCMDSFGLGLLLAYCFKYQKQALISFLVKYNYAFILLFFATVALFFLFDVDAPLNVLLFRFLTSATAFWLIGRAATGVFTGISKRFLENKVVVYLGKISYGLYVYHYIMLWVFGDFWFTHSLSFKGIAVTFLVCSAATVLVASISYYIFERPILNFKKHFEYTPLKIKVED